MVTWPTNAPGVYSYGVVRRYGTICKVDKFYVNNSRFTSRLFNKAGDLKITQPTVNGVDMRYRTHYGWAFAHNGIIYDERALVS